ncbi:27940_t:CDS:1, partial [Racocetra persica]
GLNRKIAMYVTMTVSTTLDVAISCAKKLKPANIMANKHHNNPKKPKAI